MSDETPPPPLRLKPRQRSDAETPPAAPVSPPASAPEAESKLRLKPKLPGAEPAAVAAAAPAPPEPAPTPSPPAGERIRLKPKLNQEPPQPAADPSAQPVAEEPAAAEAPPPPPPAVEDAPKPKLKIKIPGALAEAAAALADEAPPDLTVPPPFPVVLAPGAEGAPPASAPRPGGAPKPGAPRPGPPGRKVPVTVQAASDRRKRIAKLTLVAIGGVALAAGMISFAKFKFIDPPPPPASIIPKPRPPVKIQPIVEPPPLSEETSKPAEAVERPASRPVRPRPKSGETTTSATTDLAPGVTVTTADTVKAEIEASSAFRSFVADAKISGVFQGSPSRAFINGRLVRVGEVVDSSLGIRFESVEPKTKSIVFKDTTGATVSRRY